MLSNLLPQVSYWAEFGHCKTKDGTEHTGSPNFVPPNPRHLWQSVLKIWRGHLCMSLHLHTYTDIHVTIRDSLLIRIWTYTREDDSKTHHKSNAKLKKTFADEKNPKNCRIMSVKAWKTAGCVSALYWSEGLVKWWVWEAWCKVMNWHTVRTMKLEASIQDGQSTPPSVWPYLFRGAGHEKRRGEHGVVEVVPGI